MDNTILSSLITLSAMGLFLGAGLAFASKIFAVEVNPLIEEIQEMLPQANCGACGQPGCSGYAKVLVENDEKLNQCTPGGQEVIDKISKLLGKEAEAAIPVRAIIHCGGGNKEAGAKFDYFGPRDCKAALLLGGGPKACEFGCLGFGNCSRVCLFDAIDMDDNGLQVVNEDKCTGCGICVTECPKNIISLVPTDFLIYVGCVNKERAKAVKAVCSVGCTGCGLCAKEKATPCGSIIMEDNIPVIEYEKWEDPKSTASKCPASCFYDRGKRIMREVKKKDAA